MLRVIHVGTVDRNFLIKYSDGTVSILSPNELASRLKGGKLHSLDVELDPTQMEVVADLAQRNGQTMDEFIETAIIEKLLRDR